MQRLIVVDGPLFLKTKKKIVQVVEFPDQTRQIHVFDQGGVRPIISEDNISWDDLKSAEKIPLRLFFSALLGETQS